MGTTEFFFVHLGSESLGYIVEGKVSASYRIIIMVRKNITIINKLGMHARAAAKFVTLASEFDSQVQLVRGNKTVNGKSIMGVMMLAAGKGTSIEVITEGTDEEEALTRLEALIQQRFGEVA